MENKNTWKLQFKANVIASFKQLEKMHLSPDKVKEKLHDFVMNSRNQIYIESTLNCVCGWHCLLAHAACVVSALISLKELCKTSANVPIKLVLKAICMSQFFQAGSERKVLEDTADYCDLTCYA